VAVGVAVLLTGILAAAGAAIGLTETTSKAADNASPETLSLAGAGPALAQGASGGGSAGTAGAGNAAAASDGYGGLGGPTTTGTGPTSRNPGGSNSAVETAPPPPSASPNQVPSTAGAANQSTTPPSGTVGRKKK